ncbi:hypothetical protein Tco_0931656 [Tanacetum coccineum]
MFLNMDQLEKQLDNEEFQEIGSMTSFKVLETQFQMFIKSQIYLDDEYAIMTCNYFLQYTQLEILEFRDTLIQHMESVKKSINERAQHKRKYDSRVNDRQMQTIEEKVDKSKALDASLVDIESRQQHTKQPEFNNERDVDQNADQCHDTCPLPAKLTDNQTTELSNQSLESENICLKKTIAQFQKDFPRMEAHCENETLKKHYKELSDSIKTTRAKTIEYTTSLIAQHAEFKAQLQERGFAIAALKNELRKFTGNSMNTKISKPRFASQVDVNNDLSKLVTTHYLPKGKESACAKPHHTIAPGSSRYSSNNMVHNHYLEEAKKKTQASGRNSRPSVMPSAKS